MIKSKMTHAKGKQSFKAKGDLLWTVKRTDEDGKELDPLEDISTEVCLRHLSQFIVEARSKKVANAVPAKKHGKGKTVTKKTLKLAKGKKQQSSAVSSFKTLAMDDDI